MLIRLLRKLPIPLPIHQLLHLTRITNRNLRQPALTLWTLIYRRRLLFEHIIRLYDGAGDGGHDVGGGFDRFDGADGVALVDFQVDCREFDEDNVAEGFGGVGGYADRAWCVVLLGVVWVDGGGGVAVLTGRAVVR